MKKYLSYLSAFVFFFLILYGCSPVRIYSDPDLSRRSGLKYYTARPYIQIEKDQGDNIVKATVIYLPDLSSPQYIAIKDGPGSRKIDLKLTDGVINTIGIATDSELSAAIGSVAALLSKSAEAVKDISSLKGLPGTTAAVKVELYEIIMDHESTRMKKVEFLNNIK